MLTWLLFCFMLHSPIDPEQQGATTAANVVYIPTSGGTMVVPIHSSQLH